MVVCLSAGHIAWVRSNCLLNWKLDLRMEVSNNVIIMKPFPWNTSGRLSYWLHTKGETGNARLFSLATTAKGTLQLHFYMLSYVQQQQHHLFLLWITGKESSIKHKPQMPEASKSNLCRKFLCIFWWLSFFLLLVCGICGGFVCIPKVIHKITTINPTKILP